MLRCVVVAGLLLATAGCASSGETASASEAPVVRTASAAGAGKICKQDVSTGSIMPKRVCRTAAEWQALEGSNTGVLGDLQRQQMNDRTVGGTRPQ